MQGPFDFLFLHICFRVGTENKWKKGGGDPPVTVCLRELHKVKASTWGIFLTFHLYKTATKHYGEVIRATNCCMQLATQHCCVHAS